MQKAHVEHGDYPPFTLEFQAGEVKRPEEKSYDQNGAVDAGRLNMRRHEGINVKAAELMQ